MAGNLFIVSAPSGAGKTSLLSAIVKILPNIRLSVSHTTRNPRPGERPGLDYHFVTQAEFETMLDKEGFLEYAEVYGHCYGTSRLWVEETRQKGEDVILEIDWQGARQVRAQLVEARSIFILPPSQEVLWDRLYKRHQDTRAIIQKRMDKARDEMTHYREYDYLVFNDQFEDALADIQTIIRSEQLRLPVQARAQAKRLNELIG